VHNKPRIISNIGHLPIRGQITAGRTSSSDYEEDWMSGVLGFGEIDGQHVELLPIRTVMSMFGPCIGGDTNNISGNGGGGGGGTATGGGTVQSLFFSDAGNGGTGGAGGHGQGGIGVDPSL
jgi:hypothetical protein